MGISNLYNSIGSGIKKAVGSLSDYFSGTVRYNAEDYQPKQTQEPQQTPTQQYNIPPVIAPEHHKTFIEQAKLAGVSPNAFATIARREQGSTTLPNQAALIGTDPTDKGVMQVNKMHDTLIKNRFRNEIGHEYNSRDPIDSIIAARMVLEENRRQLEQMKINKSFKGEYNEQDLVDTYNTGVRGWVEAMKGQPNRLSRLARYQNAGQ